MKAAARQQAKSSQHKWVRRLRLPALDSLRAQLVARTLLPLGLLVLAFAVAGQIAYTQVTEALAKSRDAELARVEASRVADHLSASVAALQAVADSPSLSFGDSMQIAYMLRSENLSQRFDRVQVIDDKGVVIAASLSSPAEGIFNFGAYEALRSPTLPSILAPVTTRDGRTALVLSMRYSDYSGAFKGVVEGIVYIGSHRLALPLGPMPAVGRGQESQPGASKLSYLVAGDGTILWHPEAELVGTKSFISTLPASDAGSAGAILSRVSGSQAIVGYAPLNLGLLLPRTAIPPSWVTWYVVAQESWAEVVAPLNSTLYVLLLLALATMVVAVFLVARSAATLTRPVARLVTAARALSGGELRHRIETTGPTEIAELADQFNAMAAELQRSYSDLEAKVEERTQELAQANAELNRRLQESLSMQLVSANIAGTAGLKEILETIASAAAQTVGTQGSAVFLPDQEAPGQLVAAATYNLPGLPVGSRLGVDSSLSGVSYTTGRPVISAESANDSRMDPVLVRQAGARSVLSVPLVSRGQVIGVINSVNKEGGEFAEGDLRVMTLLANQAAVAIERARLYSDAQTQLKTLRAINELSLSITLSRSVEQTLLGGVEHIGNLLDASGAAVYLYDPVADTLNYTLSYELAPMHEELLRRALPVLDPSHPPRYSIGVLQAFQKQAPFLVEDMASEEYQRGWKDFIRSEMAGTGITEDALAGMGALIALPLSVREQKLGTMALYFDRPRKFDDADIQLYESFAKLVALAVHNSQLITRTSKLATVEERARLARELHDSVTQSLFSLNLTLRAARRLLGSPDGQVAELLGSAQDLAQGSLAEMRALIFELRPQALENEGLISALQKHADAVRARSGLPVHLTVLGERRLPLEVEEALYQIAREALHNVVKHAQATEAWVSLDLAAEEVTLVVRDNGRGFDPSTLREQGGSHIGLSTMQERAHAINGTLVIHSAPSSGTMLRASVNVPHDGSQESPEGVAPAGRARTED